jgi:hypothetical protein
VRDDRWEVAPRGDQQPSSLSLGEIESVPYATVISREVVLIRSRSLCTDSGLRWCRPTPPSTFCSSKQRADPPQRYAGRPRTMGQKHLDPRSRHREDAGASAATSMAPRELCSRGYAILVPDLLT